MEWIQVVEIFVKTLELTWNILRIGHPLVTLPAMQEPQETWVWSLAWEDPLEEGTATHSSFLVWRIPWTEEPCGLQAMGLQRVGYDWATNSFTFFPSLWSLRTKKTRNSSCHQNGFPHWEFSTLTDNAFWVSRTWICNLVCQPSPKAKPHFVKGHSKNLDL